MVDDPGQGLYDGIIIAVAHRQFAAMSPGQLRALGREAHVLYDLKNVLPMGDSDLRL
jgi:UDP-N-acetyl-D-galactosamine dehydrogenase